MDGNLTYKIPVESLGDVKKHLDKIIKRAAKKGLSTLTYTVGTEPCFQTTTVPFFDPFKPEKDYKTIQIECREVTLSAPTLKLAGWSFVGRIEHLKSDDGETVNMVYNAPGTTVPAIYRDRDQCCEHCSYNRWRRDTFIVQHENGETKQVGSTCLSDFLGVDASRFLAWASLIQSFTGSMSDDCEFCNGGGRQSRAYPLWMILKIAAATYMDRGYVSRNNSEMTGKMATADLIRSYLTAKTENHRNKLINPHQSDEWVEKGTKLAKNSEKWVRELAEQDYDDLGDYLSNLAVLGKVGYCPWKAIGILGSAVMAYEREQDKKAKNVENLKSRHQGKIKERVIVEDSTVIFAKPFEGMYGNGVIYKFRDHDGNLYTWFSSNQSLCLDVDEVVSFVATVKKHETDKYAGGAEVTIVNRLNTDPEAIERAKKQAEKKAKKELTTA